MGNLPKVFVNHIDKELNNYQRESKVNDMPAVDLSKILNKDTYAFNHKYLITLKDNQVITSSIIRVDDSKLLTIDNKIIFINNIKSIQEIKK
jgi:hypothetical protein